MKRLLYIVGEPGVGKSALTAELVRGRRRRVVSQPFAHTVYQDGLVQLGRERGNGFSGTDALSMSVGPKVLAALEAASWDRVLGEGDRLNYDAFFDGCAALGYTVDVALLQASEEVISERRRVRGSNQDPAWLAGRRTKVHNMQARTTMVLDASRSLRELAAELATHPVLQVNHKEEP